MSPRIVEIRQNVLKQNDILARALRERHAAAGVFVVNLVSGPGAGKTELLEVALRTAGATHRVAALTGDLATDNDARRLARSGAPVRQISTGTVCHLDAQMVDQALDGWDVGPLDYLFIENVGNLVCPASYDIGEHLRVVLLSVTDGEDKPLKYPTIFNSADVALITKLDLADAAGFDRNAAHANIAAVHPGMPIFETSGRTGVGIREWLSYLGDRADSRNSNSSSAAT